MTLTTVISSKQTVSTSSHSSISGGSHAGTSSSLTTTSTKISAMDSMTPKNALSTGAIVGTATGLLFVLAASVTIFIFVHRRRHQTVRANLSRVSPLLTDDVAHTKSGGANITPNGTINPQEKSRYIHHPSVSQTEPRSEIRQSSFIPGLDPLVLVSAQGDGDRDPDNRRVTVETNIIERMAEHIHYLESQLAGDGFSEAPPPTYVSS
ncbi:hypothetical protein BDP27DRAFT_1335108 [Rhodocollybia butyracea]|uniref:Uncharacterized protein n=1 Tax=Rhodocollybia butyracea TaxID=206335 RepID=A0A9P5U384_9AGAR|nr:hypothetical protein BDP27DRAFT_1335108 [Rhodocollybia butyracea]